MKKLFFICSVLATLILFAQKAEVKMYLKDGKTMTGLVKIKNKIEFRKSKKDKNITNYERSEISKIEVLKDGEVFQTTCFKAINENSDILKELIIEHEDKPVSLYREISYDPTNSGRTYNIYYVKKEGENMVKMFPVGAFGNGSDKATKNYFSDCSKLIELINRNAFEMYFANKPELKKSEKFRCRLIEIVKYYNTKCFEE